MRICVAGLGYVGLPLAVEFGKTERITGFDVNEKRIEELRKGKDRTGEVTAAQLKKADIKFTTDPKDISLADFIIIAVPTPITNAKTPDFSYLKSASKIVGQNLRKGSIVVYESTVYPGATEEICVPVLEKYSGMACGKDFKVGYSPERINPGDREHRVDNIVKVVSGMDKESLNIIAETYARIIKAGIHKASSIKVAEAAKVIENIQRDLNIALMNELSLIFNRLDIPTKDVIDAAGTKWNFHKYFPGLVGGHCIGVDPYYLTFKAQQLGYDPQIILAGRHINEYMSRHVAEMAVKALGETDKPLNKCRVLIMGLTFKENVPDFRNSKAKDLITELKKYNLDISVCEPLLDDKTVKDVFGIANISLSRIKNKFDCIILFSLHDVFRKMTIKKLRAMMAQNPSLIDIKSFYDKKEAAKNRINYFSL